MIRATSCTECLKPLAAETSHCDECQAPVVSLVDAADLLPLQFFSAIDRLGYPRSLEGLVKRLQSEPSPLARAMKPERLELQKSFAYHDIALSYRRLTALLDPSLASLLEPKAKSISFISSDEAPQTKEVTEALDFLRSEVLRPARECLEGILGKFAAAKRELDLLEPALLLPKLVRQRFEADVRENSFYAAVSQQTIELLEDYATLHAPQLAIAADAPDFEGLKRLVRHSLFPTNKRVAKTALYLRTGVDPGSFREPLEHLGSDRFSHFTARPFRDAYFLEMVAQVVSWRTWRRDPFTSEKRPLRSYFEMPLLARTLAVAKDEEIEPWALIAQTEAGLELTPAQKKKFAELAHSSSRDLRFSAKLAAGLWEDAEIRQAISEDPDLSALRWVIGHLDSSVRIPVLARESLTEAEYAEAASALRTATADMRRTGRATSFDAATTGAIERHFVRKLTPAEIMRSKNRRESYGEVVTDAWAVALLVSHEPARTLRAIHSGDDLDLNYEFFWARKEIDLSLELFQAAADRGGGAAGLAHFLSTFTTKWLKDNCASFKFDPRTSTLLMTPEYREARERMGWILRDAYKEIGTETLLKDAAMYLLFVPSEVEGRWWINQLSLLVEMSREKSAKPVFPNVLAHALTLQSTWPRFFALAFRDKGYVGHELGELIASFTQSFQAHRALAQPEKQAFVEMAFDLLEKEGAIKEETPQMIQVAMIAAALELLPADSPFEARARKFLERYPVGHYDYDLLTLTALRKKFPPVAEPAAPAPAAAKSAPVALDLGPVFAQMATVQGLATRFATQLMQERMQNLMKAATGGAPFDAAALAKVTQEHSSSLEEINKAFSSLRESLTGLGRS